MNLPTKNRGINPVPPKPKPSWLNLTLTQQQELDAFSRMPGWRLLSKESLPTVFPQSFREKLDSGIVIAAPTSSGGTWLVFNALRVDSRDQAIDQEPFAIIVHSTGAASSGMFLHHGDWPGRTESPPSGFWDRVQESGIGNYFYSNPPSGLTSGDLYQLPPGHREAFEKVTAYHRSLSINLDTAKT